MNPRASPKPRLQGIHYALVKYPALLFAGYIDTIKPSVSIPDFGTETLYFFHFFKEQYSLLAKKPELNVNRLVLHSHDLSPTKATLDALVPQPRLVEVNGIEPMASCLQSRRSPN